MTIRKIIAAFIGVVMITSLAVVTTSAADDKAKGITVHYYCEEGAPTIYYWNSLPENIETKYPGEAMDKDPDMGKNWYKYTFDNLLR